jgi:hypothetical protein
MPRHVSVIVRHIIVFVLNRKLSEIAMQKESSPFAIAT